MNQLTHKIVLLSFFLAFGINTAAQESSRSQRNDQMKENAAQQNQNAEQQTTAQKQSQTVTEEQRQQERYVYSPGIMLPRIDSSDLNAPKTPQINPKRRTTTKNWLIERYDYSGRKERASIRSEQAFYLNTSCVSVIDRLRAKQNDKQDFQYLSTSLDTTRLLKKEVESSIKELSQFEAVEFQQLKQQEEDTLKLLNNLNYKIEQAIYLFF